MEDRIGRLETVVDELRQTVARLEGRVSTLEGASARRGPDLEEVLLPAPRARQGQPEGGAAGRPVSWAALVGRTLLVFGGAYLLRALTEGGFWPAGAGVLVGLAYALLWLVLADRSPGERGVSAAFHGTSAVLIAFPLLAEATTRFGFLHPISAALALAVFACLALWVAVRRSRRSIAWTTALAAAGTALFLARGAAAELPMAAFLVLLGVATLWVAYVRGWRALPWLTAVTALFGVLLVVGAVVVGRSPVSVTAAQLLALALVAAYLVSFAVRTLVQGEDVGLFEAMQTALVLALGYGGAITLLRQEGAGLGPHLLGALGLLAGLAAYTAAFAPRLRHERRHKRFFYFATLALVLALSGSALELPAAALATVYSLAAVGCAVASGRFGRVTLSLHSSLFLLAAVVAAGLGRVAGAALMAPATEPWRPIGLSQLVVLAAIVAYLAIPVAQASERWGRLAVLPRLLALVVLVWGLGGSAVWLAARWIGGPPGPEADAGAIAALRTVVLAAAAVLLAWAGRHRRFHEASWLVYPLLLLGGLKLLVDDFPNGRPVTLFVALAALGAALLAAARLHREQGAAEAAAGEGETVGADSAAEAER